MLNTILAYSTSYDSSFANIFPVAGLGVGIGGIFMIFYLIFILFVSLISIAGTALWVIMLIDIIQRQDNQFPDATSNSKVMWLMIVLLTGYIGALIYYFMVYKKFPRNTSGVQAK